MWTKHHGVSDPDQSYILEELVRYLQHSSSGVMSFDRMPSSWKDVCGAVHNRVPLKKNSTEVEETVGGWYQLTRNASLDLGLSIGRSVTQFLKKNHSEDGLLRLVIKEQLDDASVIVPAVLMVPQEEEFQVSATNQQI